MLLVDKYRPKKITEVLGNDEIMAIISKKGGDFPHLLFTGPPGTGKTTLSHLLKENFETLELNASDDRGIDVVRGKIKGFCSQNIPNKLVILDECDSLTAAAQQALRRLMETTDTKFILICNHISKLIEPIQSRCAVLRFSKIPASAFQARIKEICEVEGIQVTESGLETLFALSNGDIRACLNTLQGVLHIGKPIDGEFLYKLSGVPSQGRIQDVLKAVKKKDGEEALRLFEVLWCEKYESADLMSGFMRAAKAIESYEGLRVIGKYHMRVVGGEEGKVQFCGMIHELMSVDL